MPRHMCYRLWSTQVVLSFPKPARCQQRYPDSLATHNCPNLNWMESGLTLLAKHESYAVVLHRMLGWMISVRMSRLPQKSETETPVRDDIFEFKIMCPRQPDLYITGWIDVNLYLNCIKDPNWTDSLNEQLAPLSEIDIFDSIVFNS